MSTHAYDPSGRGTIYLFIYLSCPMPIGIENFIQIRSHPFESVGTQIKI